MNRSEGRLPSNRVLLICSKRLVDDHHNDNCKTRVSYDLVMFHEEHQSRLLRRGAWSSFEVSVRIIEEGEVVTYLCFIANFSKIVKPHTSLTERNQKKERVKPRRVRAMAMTIQYGVRGMKLAAQSEAFKQENDSAESFLD
ncbi:hypothetical protein Tco_0840175 [Tanacetum coccineum]|uniref:Uncharacterized protein n=1 Tax=Tanacetum coccineum TaxID=301880 RepID=A0ABQ5AWI3_9ASTR